MQEEERSCQDPCWWAFALTSIFTIGTFRVHANLFWFFRYISYLYKQSQEKYTISCINRIKWRYFLWDHNTNQDFVAIFRNGVHVTQLIKPVQVDNVIVIIFIACYEDALPFAIGTCLWPLIPRKVLRFIACPWKSQD